MDSANPPSSKFGIQNLVLFVFPLVSMGFMAFIIYASVPIETSPASNVNWAIDYDVNICENVVQSSCGSFDGSGSLLLFDAQHNNKDLISYIKDNSDPSVSLSYDDRSDASFDALDIFVWMNAFNDIRQSKTNEPLSGHWQEKTHAGILYTFGSSPFLHFLQSVDNEFLLSTDMDGISIYHSNSIIVNEFKNALDGKCNVNSFMLKKNSKGKVATSPDPVIDEALLPIFDSKYLDSIELTESEMEDDTSSASEVTGIRNNYENAILGLPDYFENYKISNESKLSLKKLKLQKKAVSALIKMNSEESIPSELPSSSSDTSEVHRLGASNIGDPPVVGLCYLPITGVRKMTLNELAAEEISISAYQSVSLHLAKTMITILRESPTTSVSESEIEDLINNGEFSISNTVFNMAMFFTKFLPGTLDSFDISTIMTDIIVDYTKKIKKKNTGEIYNPLKVSYPLLYENFDLFKTDLWQDYEDRIGYLNIVVDAIVESLSERLDELLIKHSSPDVHILITKAHSKLKKLKRFVMRLPFVDEVDKITTLLKDRPLWTALVLAPEDRSIYRVGVANMALHRAFFCGLFYKNMDLRETFLSLRFGLDTINAFYTPKFNSIVLLPAITGTFFVKDSLLKSVVKVGSKDQLSKQLSPEEELQLVGEIAWTMGGYGYVVGHEITHSIDSSGIMYEEDASSLQGEWLSVDQPDLKDSLDNLFGKCLQSSYSSFYELHHTSYGTVCDRSYNTCNFPVDGRYTLGENIADNGGARIAHRAMYKIIKKLLPHFDADGTNKDVTPFFTSSNEPDLMRDGNKGGVNRVFLSALAATWCSKMSTIDYFIRYQPSRLGGQGADNHSPDLVRSFATLHHFDPKTLQKTFGCQPTDKNYHRNELSNKRCEVW